MKSIQTIKEVLEKNSIQLSTGLLEEFFSFSNNNRIESLFKTFINSKGMENARTKKRVQHDIQQRLDADGEGLWLP